MLFFSIFYSSKNPEKKKNCISVSTKILTRTAVFNFDNIWRNASWAPNQHIRMISKESCDTEDWSNDAENLVLQTKF